MNLADLQKESIRGWNTWYNESVTTHVLLPYGNYWRGRIIMEIPVWAA